MDSWQDWQKSYQFGTIVIWPPDEVRNFVNQQRSTYDPLSQSYSEAHISVTQPLQKHLSENEWNQVKKIVGNYEIFQVEFGPVNSFLPYPCIWYEIEPHQRVLELRQALHQTNFFNLDLPHTEDFIPHMTITEGLSGPTVDKNLLEQLRKESRRDSFPCQELTCIVPDQQFCFTNVKTLPLAPEKT